MNEKQAANRGYHVTSVEKITTPEGMSGNNWYQYIIGEGKTRVVGKIAGTLKEVTAHAEAQAEQINARHGNKSGYSAYTAKKKR